MSDQTPAEAVKATTEADPTVWEEQPAVTGRPNDIGPDGPSANSTFAERAQARNKQQRTEVAKSDEDEVKPERKAVAKKASARKGG